MNAASLWWWAVMIFLIVIMSDPVGKPRLRGLALVLILCLIVLHLVTYQGVPCRFEICNYLMNHLQKRTN